MITFRCLFAFLGALVGFLLALPIIVVGIPFAAVASLTRAVAYWLEPRITPWGELIEFDPAMGWKPKPNLNTHALADEVFHLTTDAEGWRGKKTIAESDIVVFGDSFAWGYGIDDKHFFADLNRTPRIKTIGTVGYNMVQELLWMQRLSSQLKGKLVVWLIYYGNDLYENLVPDMCNYRMPFVREINGTGDWEIVTSHIRPTKWFHPVELRADRRDYLEKLAKLCSPSSLSERAYSACGFLIRKGRDLCSYAGTQLVVMTIPETTQLSSHGLQLLRSRGVDPTTFDPDFPDKKLSELCCELGIQLIALKEHLDVRDYQDRDPHWNEKGHQRVADLLSDLRRSHFFTGEWTGSEVTREDQACVGKVSIRSADYQTP